MHRGRAAGRGAFSCACAMAEPDPGPGSEVRSRPGRSAVRQAGGPLAEGQAAHPVQPAVQFHNFWCVSTRLAFDRTTTRRELEIIGTDLHCNAVRIVTDPALATWPWFSGR